MKTRVKKYFRITLCLVLSLLLSLPVNVAEVKAATVKASTIRNYVLGKVGQSYPSGYCLMFVEECYQNLGANRPYNCCASKSRNVYRVSNSSADIPIGATVYFDKCGGGPCRNCGSTYYGHVGIYVGDGYFVHATGGKVQKSTISSWANKYAGWGYCGNFRLEDDITKKLDTSFSVDLNDNSRVSNTICISGSIRDAGSNPVIQLYLDYNLLEERSANGCSDYSFYLNTNAYTNGQHTLGIRLRNSEGYDVTQWRVIDISNVVKVSGISLSCWDIVLNQKNQNYCLTARIEPENATNKKIVWTSGNTSVASVDNSGKVTAKGNGNTVITAKTQDGDYKATCRVKVNTGGVAYGDVSLDGKISATDLSMLNNAARGALQLTKEEKLRADLDGDGKITKSDTDLLSKYILGDIDTFPVEKMLAFISLERLPDKQSYYTGEKLDLTGLKVKAWYNNQTSKAITQYTSQTSMTSPGSKEVKISYTEAGVTKSVSFSIYVKEIEKCRIDYNAGDGKLVREAYKKDSFIYLNPSVQPKSYQIYFNANGGKAEKNKVQLSRPVKGWCERKDGQGTIYPLGGSYRLSKDVTLYLCYGKAVLNTLPAAEKEGYNFLGWYTKDGVRVNDGITVTEDITLTAKWERKTEEIVPLPDELLEEDNTNIDLKDDMVEDMPEDIPEKTPEIEIPEIDTSKEEPAEGGIFEEEIQEDEFFEEETSGEDIWEEEEETEKEEYPVAWNVSSYRIKEGKSTTALKVFLSEKDKVLAYYSYNKDIVTISQKGKITAKKPGKTTVAVITEHGAKASVEITVVKNTTKTKKLTVNKKTITLKPGYSVRLKTKVLPVDSTEKVTFSSSNKKVALVNKNGVVKGKKKGKADILVRSGKKTVKVKVVVKK